MSDLPTGWVWAELAQVCTSITDGDHQAPPQVPDGIPFLVIGNIRNQVLDFTDCRHVPPDYYESLGTIRRPQKGDVLYSLVGSYGISVLVTNDAPFCVQRHIGILRPSPEASSSFLSVALSSHAVFQQATQYATGTAQLTVPLSGLRRIRIPLPPQLEQKRIVAAVEEQLSRLDAGVAALERARQSLKRMRRAVLESALKGQLRSPSSEVTNDDLSEISRIPKPIRTSDLPKGWEWTTIGSICDCLDSRRVPINKAERLRRGGHLPYYGANGQVGWIDKYLFDEPLVLVVEDETFTGRQRPFSYKITGKSWVNNHAHVLRPRPGVNVDFLNYSLAYYPFIPLTTGTTGRRKLTQRALLTAPLPLPPEDEQEAIVAEVDRRMSLTDHLEGQVNSALDRASACRQSILIQALSGRLVPQDVSDESACVLLQRIAAEKASSNDRRTIRGRKAQVVRQEASR